MDEFSQHTGDIVRYRHPLNPQVIYTEGVKHLAMDLKAYWLINAIASYFNTPEMAKAIREDRRLESLQFWKLTKHQDASATLICQADSGEPSAITQEIRWTDCPVDMVKIWAGYDGRNWTLYLPSEH